MKLLLSLGAGVILVVGGIVYALTSHHAPVVQAAASPSDAVVSQAPSPAANTSVGSDAGSSAAPVSGPSTAPAADNTPSPWSGGNGGAHGQHGQRMQQLFAQLDLTDTQKQQIAQIRQTVTDRRERHEEIMNVLTPDQRAKFQELRAQFHGHRGGQEQPGATAPTTPPAST